MVLVNNVYKQRDLNVGEKELVKLFRQETVKQAFMEVPLVEMDLLNGSDFPKARGSKILCKQQSLKVGRRKQNHERGRESTREVAGVKNQCHRE